MCIRKLKIALLLLLIFFLLSCDRNNLIGEWKPTTVKFFGHLESEKPSTIDLINTDSLRIILMREQLDELSEYDSAHFRDTSGVGERIDSAISYFQDASLTLNSNMNFVMINNSMILPDAIPGWHFGDTLIGKWLNKGDSLIFDLGDTAPHFYLKFLIIQQNKELLVLQESQYGNEMIPNRQITFKRK